MKLELAPAEIVRKLSPRSFLRLMKDFLFASLPVVVLHALIGSLALSIPAAGFAYLWSRNSGWKAAAAGWTLAGTYALLGFVGGGFAGLAKAAMRALAAFERRLRQDLQHGEGTPGATNDDGFPRIPLAELRKRYEEILEAIAQRAGIGGRFRLPSFLQQFFKARLRQAIVEDFIADCEQRGVQIIDFPVVRNWMLSKGISEALRSLNLQFRWQWWLLSGGLGLLASVMIVMALVFLARIL